MFLFRLGIRAVALAGVVAGAAEAAIVEYTDRGTWTAAIGAVTGGDNFNVFASDAGFSSTFLVLKDGIRIGARGEFSDEFNHVDVPPYFDLSAVPADPADYPIDGSPFAMLNTGTLVSETLPYIGFLPAVRAFGADFRDLNDLVARTEIQVFAGVVLLATFELAAMPDSALQFWGVAATAGETITEIRFVRKVPDYFGVDNIEIARAAAEPGGSIPEPATLTLLGIGVASLGVLRWHRGRDQAHRGEGQG